MKISKELSQIMKGYAILSIALHNFIHTQDGFVQENEKKFLAERADLFFERLGNPSWSLIGDLLSFLGWIGVPVFVFLSGYGLSKKYSNVSDLSPKDYIKHSWLKLFLLLLPAALLYMVFFGILGQWNNCLNNGLSLSLLANLIPDIVSFNPGVYWYFGLTFELYLFFILIKKINNKKTIALIGIICLIATAVFNPIYFPEHKAIYWLKHNFIGWVPIFILGILCAEGLSGHGTLSNKWLAPLSAILCLALSIVLNSNFYLWLCVPFTAIYFFYYLSISASRWKPTRLFGLWLGKYSPCIFVVHPIARTITESNSLGLSFTPKIILYIVLVPIGAIIYNKIYSLLSNRFLDANK